MAFHCLRFYSHPATVAPVNHIAIGMDALDIHWLAPTDSPPRELSRYTGYLAYQQHPAYGDALHDFNGKCLRALILHQQQPIGWVQCSQRTIARTLHILLAMRGPVWFNESISNDLKAAAYRALNASCPLPRPRLLLWMPESPDHEPLHLAGLHRIVTGYSTPLLDLNQSENQLLAAMDGKWRNQLRSSQKHQLACVPVGLQFEHYQWLLEEEMQQRQRIGYKAFSPALVSSYQAYAGQNSLLILRADDGKDTVAGMLCLIHGHSATYHIGWSNPLGKEKSAHNLLLWESMRRLKARGIRWFDLGGVNTQDGAGLTRFKLGSGAQLRTLDGMYQ